MTTLAPLAMSQTKDDLLKHLNMGTGTYALMAKEVDYVYKWLTSEKRHLKKNCKRKPPYDWSDIVEKSKDEAIYLIAQSGDSYTSYYWNLAVPTEGCTNWIARWFLYHKFRYRDGRNRNPVKGGDGKYTYHSSSKTSRHSLHRQIGGRAESSGYENTLATYFPTTGSNTLGYDSSSPVPTAPSGDFVSYNAADTYDTSSAAYNPDGQVDEQASKTYYDPVRDV